MRNYADELKNRIEFIQEMLIHAKADGIVYGNSGGKDSVLVGILCQMACANTLGVMMPAGSRRNYEEDLEDAKCVSEKFGIEYRVLDLGDIRSTLTEKIGEIAKLNDMATSNISPRLRMISLYAIAAAENRLIAGTGNRSEIHMGYFTKWGDGACDFNPIADLTVTETYEFLKYLDAPREIIEKSPSAALYDGQTDEQDMGITYAKIDEYLLTGNVTEEDYNIISGYHSRSEHKRRMPLYYTKKKV